MTDITPIWIDGYYDTRDEADSAMRELLIDNGVKGEGVPTPALTLDQIEGWLKERIESAYEVDELKDMLAQVQAMKEGK